MQANGTSQLPTAPVKMKRGRFKEVAALLRSGDPAKGFTRAAEICLDRFEALSKEMQPYVVLKLAIELHKHGMFCEVAQDKTRSTHDAAAYAAYQAYLAGQTDVPVAVGLPNIQPSTLALDVDEEDPDGEVERPE